jgi:hypothetical protein
MTNRKEQYRPVDYKINNRRSESIKNSIGIKTKKLNGIMIVLLLVFTILLIVYNYYILKLKNENKQLRHANKKQEEQLKQFYSFQLRYKGIKEKIENKKYWKGFKMSKLKNNELVQGMKGNYFYIKIFDINTNEQIRFQQGRCRIEKFEYRFKESISQFNKEILRELKEILPYKIFVKCDGDYDINISNSDWEDKFKYRRLKILEKIDRKDDSRGERDLYSSVLWDYVLQKPLDSRDISIMRSSYICEKFTSFLSENLTELFILDGNDVSQKKGVDNSVDIILWINSPEEFF